MSTYLAPVAFENGFEFGEYFSAVSKDKRLFRNVSDNSALKINCMECISSIYNFGLINFFEVTP